MQDTKTEPESFKYIASAMHLLTDFIELKLARTHLARMGAGSIVISAIDDQLKQLDKKMEKTINELQKENEAETKQ
jgi:hypothetical protein